MKFGQGQPVRRREDWRLVTGCGRYTDDLALKDQAYAFFVRSPHAHARIRRVDITAAESAPGVIGVLTHLDVADSGPVPALVQMKNRDGTAVPSTPKMLLPGDKARYCGEAVAMVVASRPAQARDGGDLVVVDYDVLPAVVTAENASRGVPIWDHIAGNLVLDWADGDEKRCADAFAAAARTVSLDLVQNRVMPSPLEPRGAIGVHDHETGHYTLYSGTQGVAGFRSRLAPILGVAPDTLRVVTEDVGGGFGQKTAVMPEQVLVLLAAKRFRRPIKWTGDRTEAFLADTHGRNVSARAELALDREARILAIRVNGSADLGAYLSNIGANVVTSGGLRILGGVYRVPVAFVRVKGYVTNSSCISAYRGAGRPEAAYITERLLDAAAAEFGLDRIEIRRRNLLVPEELPHRNWKGLTIDSGNFLHNLEEAAQRADWQGFNARRARSEARGLLRGRGISYYVEVSGGPPGPEPAVICFADGNKVEVHLGTQSNGQGHETSFAQLLSERLGVSYDRIAIKEGDTDSGVEGHSSVGSRSLQTAGNAIVLAAAEVIRKGKQAAAHILQAGGSEIAFSITDGIGRFHVVGTERTISLGDLAATLRSEALPGFEHGLDTTAAYDGVPTFPNGCHICEVEIDPETGHVAVERYTIVDDFGRVVNPLLVEGQVQGGVAQGLGQALLEQAVYDPDSGQLLTGTFLDYALPRAEDIPSPDFRYNEIPCTTNPLGSKGAGEAGTVGALPAVMSAVADALGVRHIDMPATSERIWRVLSEKTRTVSPAIGRTLTGDDSSIR